MKKYENLKEKVYDIVKGKIIKGEYRPNTHLDEKALITELEVSRTPFREAMNRLELEGLIKIIPRRGFFVSEISVKNINDIFQARHIIEPELIECSMESIDREKLVQIRNKFQMWRELSRKELHILDWELHYLILESTKNDYLIKMMSNIYEQNQRMRTLAIRETTRVQESVGEHLRIIDAILTGDVHEAKEACKVHTRNSQLDSLNMIGFLNL